MALALATQSMTYKKAPSDILGIEDKYEAYCINEAIAYIIRMEREGKERLKPGEDVTGRTLATLISLGAVQK